MPVMARPFALRPGNFSNFSTATEWICLAATGPQTDNKHRQAVP